MKQEINDFKNNRSSNVFIKFIELQSTKKQINQLKS